MREPAAAVSATPVVETAARKPGPGESVESLPLGTSRMTPKTTAAMTGTASASATAHRRSPTDRPECTVTGDRQASRPIEASSAPLDDAAVAGSPCATLSVRNELPSAGRGRKSFKATPSLTTGSRVVVRLSMPLSPSAADDLGNAKQDPGAALTDAATQPVEGVGSARWLGKPERELGLIGRR